MLVALFNLSCCMDPVQMYLFLKIGNLIYISDIQQSSISFAMMIQRNIF